MRSWLVIALILLMAATSLADRRQFFAFDNGLNDIAGLDEKAALLKRLGYDGIAWRPNGKTAEMLAALDKHGLKMFATYVTLLPDLESCPIPNRVRSEIEALKGRDTIVWLMINGKSSDEIVVPAIQRIADIAHANGLDVALYPHANCYTDTVETNARLIELAERNNVKASFNLHHFLAQHPADELESKLKAVAPTLALVSINGADIKGHAIKALGDGTYPVERVMRVLDEINYDGSVGLQCYNVNKPDKDHLKQSIKYWKSELNKD